MKWLYKIFNAATPEEQQGISLENPKWEIFPIRDMPAFLHALNSILPAGSVLYLEGGSPDEEIRSFLESRKVTSSSKVVLGTIWPRPLRYHLPFTPTIIKELAEIMERHATPEGAVHFRNDTPMFTSGIPFFWNEAFSKGIQL